MGNSTGKTTFPIRVRQIQGAEFTGLIFSIIEVLEGKTISEIIVSTTCKNLWLFNFVVLGSKKKQKGKPKWYINHNYIRFMHKITKIV